MFQLLWNYLMVVLFLGASKAALSLRWPTIGEWRYDDLHPSLRYRDSSRAQKLLVNLVFFLVYPFVLLWRWYRAGEWTDWTDVEKHVFEQNVGPGEDELLRRGALRGRMIIQKEILLSPEDSADESAHFGGYNSEADGGFVEAGPFHSDDGMELTGEEALPLNLSKGKETHLHAEFVSRKDIGHSRDPGSYEPTTADYNYAADEDVEDAEQEDGEEVALIVPSPKAPQSHTSYEVALKD